MPDESTMISEGAMAEERTNEVGRAIKLVSTKLVERI